MDPAIKPIRDDMYVFGPAITVRPAPGDHLISMYATMLARPGDVIVVEGGGRVDIAIWGFGMSRSLKIRNLAGVVVDGMVLDRKGLLGIDVPVFARGANAGWGTRSQPGSINVPIVCGGRNVFPGDLIVGDADGVVVVPRERVHEAESLVSAYNRDLAQRAAELREGTRAYFEIVGLQEVIAALQIPEFDRDPNGAQ
jgi:4-hydroxy-4-methyl-2-oxoglutarate aldolase